MSVLRIKDQTGGWKSITSLKGEKGEQGNSDSQFLAKQLSEFMVFDEMQLEVDNFELGTWAYSTKVTNLKRIRSKIAYPVKNGYKIVYTNPSFKIYLGLLETKTGSSYIQASGWKAISSSEVEYSITKEGYLNIIFETNDGSTASLDDFDTEIKIVSTGFSPERGVDYWTAQDKAEIIQDTVNEIGIQTVTITETTPTITGVENTRYICGEVSTISIIPPSQGIIDVIFTSGSTIAVLTLPQTVMIPDNFAIEANKIYEINILDGIYGAVTSWEVPL